MSQAQARGLGMFSFLALAISITAFAAKPAIGTPAFAEANISASAIQWQASGSYERLILTVSGPEGFALSKEFEVGLAAILRVQELGAQVPADGHYTWELRAVPRVSAETKRQLAAAREANDDQAAARIQAQAGLNREMVSSGAFTIQRGSFVIGAGEEPETPAGRKVTANALKPAPLDVVTPDDMIIQGSLCVGLDCVNNESFGFDTIRLKENNTRIKFDDTSTSSGFPANDWQLTANDSASGGASKFSIEDITNNKVPFTTTAGAATNSIFVDSTGRVGFRTSTPVLDLHISTSNTPAIRQEQTSAGGFTAQTWDIGANEANWFVRDVTGGSRLPLRIRPGAPTSSIDISATGNVGIGTASPAAKLTIDSDGSAVRIQQTDPASFAGFTWYEGVNQKFAINALGSTSVFPGGANAVQLFQVNNAPMIFFTNGTERMRITGSGNIGLNNVPSPTNPIQHSSGASLTAVGVWTDASSRELKEDICDIDSAEARATLLGLEPVKFFYKADLQDLHAGFIAEDVPELVATKDRKTLSSMDIVAVLTKVVQDQQKIISELSQRVEQLEKEGHKSQ
jgi:hypothetical protein